MNVHGIPGEVAIGVLIAGLIIGLVLVVVFLVQYRPNRLLRFETLNAAGWVIVIGLLYARSLALVFLKLPYSYPSWSEAVISTGFLLAIDALLAMRVISFARHLRRERKKIDA